MDKTLKERITQIPIKDRLELLNLITDYIDNHESPTLSFYGQQPKLLLPMQNAPPPEFTTSHRE